MAGGLFYDWISSFGFAGCALGADQKIDLMKLALEVSPAAQWVDSAEGRQNQGEWPLLRPADWAAVARLTEGVWPLVLRVHPVPAVVQK